MESTSAKSSAIDVPALAETDLELWTDFLGDYISVWLRNSQQFIAEQQQKMYKMALCPFLFGVSRNVPQAWLEVLRIYGIIETDRENKMSPLSEQEMETLDMVETIFMRCSQLVSNKNDLKTILNFIYEVEERSALLRRIDMSYALQEVTSLEVFASMWAPIKRFYEKRKRQAHVCIIYYFKIISYHITQYGQNGTDRVTFLEFVLSGLLRPDLLSVTEEDASKSLFGDGNYSLAVEQLSALIEKEPFRNSLYSLRSEAYTLLCDYWAALSDCRRTIVLDPSNYLHYYKAAKLYLELGLLGKAEDLNHQSLEHSLEQHQQAKVEELTQEIYEKRRMTRLRETSTSYESEERELYHTQYRKLICEGSELYLSETYSRAADQFKAALDVIARSTSEELAIEGDDLAFIWLVYGLSCVKTEQTRNLQAAIEKFKAIISRTLTFPAAFYGLALAYVVLKRYKEAGETLKTGLARLEECEDVKVFHWPGTETVVEETVRATLKKLMEDSLEKTMFPPKPDAICRFHTDTDSLKREMYFSDPDYKSHVCFKCSANCSIDFHVQCWRPSDGCSRGKHNYKEVLDTQCPTPACWGMITDIFICRPDPDKNLRISSQMVNRRPSYNPPRRKLKIKTQSPSKLERKMEMKRLRKERRQQRRQVIQDQQANEEQLENVTTKIIMPEEEMVNLNIGRTGTVLRKEEPEMVVEKRQKASKSKKKDKKQKQYLAVDLQFKGDENKERYGINSLDDDGDVVNLPPAAGLLPIPGSEPSTGTNKSLPLQQPALEIALYEFFYKLLITKGPLDLLSKELEEHTKPLSEEAQTYILSYGGLGRFLAAHRQFQVSPNKIVSAIPTSLLGTPHLNPHLLPQVNPHLLPQVNPHLLPQVNPKLVAHLNAWENRQHKPTEGHSARLSQLQWLNPGAKEFVPQDTATAQGLPKTQQKEQWDLADGCAAGGKSESSEELPPPAADEDDDGFTTVVSKKRGNIQKLLQPSVPRFAFLKPASSFSASDEVHVDSQLPQKAHQASVTVLEGDQKKGDNDKHPNVSHGKMDSLDAFCDDSLDTEPRKGAFERKTGIFSAVMNNPGPGSNVPDISADDLHRRVSSPALSTNSGSSSGRAEGSQTGSQTSGQHTSLRPLKAPSIVLPTRGKNKRPLVSKLYTHQPPQSAGSSRISDGCEVESVSSTASDRENTWWDARAPSTDQLQMPPVAESAGKVRTSAMSEPMGSTFSGQDVFSSSAQDSPFQAPYLSKRFQDMLTGCGKTSYSDGIISSNSGFDDGIQRCKKMWSESLASEKLLLDSSLNGLNSLMKSDMANERHEGNRTEMFYNFPCQAHGQASQDCEGSEKSPAWPLWHWDPPENYRKTSGGSGDDIRVPPSDPWQNKDVALAHFYTHLYRESPELPTMSADTNTCEVSSRLSSKGVKSDVFGPFSKEFGLTGSGKGMETDPWSSRSVDSTTSLTDKVIETDPWSSRLADSPTLLTTNITFHSHKPLSPFPAWVSVATPSSSAEPKLQSSATEPSYTSGASTKPSVYTSNTSTKSSVFSLDASAESSGYKSSASTKSSFYTVDSSTKSSSTASEPLSFTVNSSSEPPLPTSLTGTSMNKSNIEPSASSPSFAAEANLPKPAQPRTTGEGIAPTWRLEHLGAGSLDSRTVEWKSVDTQTSLSGTQIDEMLVSTNMLKDSRAQLASVLHEKLELQEQLSRESSVRDQLKLENSRLLTKIHIAETSAERWKDECNQLIKTKDQLNDQVRAQAEIINQLNQQLDIFRKTSLNAQMDALTMKKELVTSKIDMKQLEALHHFQRLTNVIAQAQTSDKQLPESVYEKQTEFSEYISACEGLTRHIQGIYVRLAEDLQHGLPIDTSKLDVSLPMFPKSPTESSERPQASTSSLPHVDFSNRVQPSSPHSVASMHSSPSRGRSSIHSSPSRGRSSIHSSPSHSRRTSPPRGISSIHFSPSHSGPARGISPPCSSASLRTSPPRGRAPIRTSPPHGRDHQQRVTAWSALEPKASSKKTEDEDAEEYLKMIYGSSSSKDSLNEATVATAASKSHPQGVDRRQKDAVGRQGWNPTSSRLLSSPTRLATPNGRVSQGILGSNILSSHSQSNLKMETARTTLVPNIRPQLKPHTSHAGPEQSQQQMPYFERIVQTVQEKMPGCSRNKIQEIVDTLRKNNGGTLSGWTFERLANEILDMFLDQEQDLATIIDDFRPDEHLSSNSIWDYDLVCSICQYRVEPREALILSCGHKFHEACVQKWLTNDRSCPNCRSHALLPDDFPVLK